MRNMTAKSRILQWESFSIWQWISTTHKELETAWNYLLGVFFRSFKKALFAKFNMKIIIKFGWKPYTQRFWSIPVTIYKGLGNYTDKSEYGFKSCHWINQERLSLHKDLLTKQLDVEKGQEGQPICKRPLADARWLAHIFWDFFIHKEINANPIEAV